MWVSFTFLNYLSFISILSLHCSEGKNPNFRQVRFPYPFSRLVSESQVIRFKALGREEVSLSHLLRLTFSEMCVVPCKYLTSIETVYSLAISCFWKWLRSSPQFWGPKEIGVAHSPSLFLLLIPGLDQLWWRDPQHWPGVVKGSPPTVTPGLVSSFLWSGQFSLVQGKEWQPWREWRTKCPGTQTIAEVGECGGTQSNHYDLGSILPHEHIHLTLKISSEVISPQVSRPVQCPVCRGTCTVWPHANPR